MNKKAWIVSAIVVVAAIALIVNSVTSQKTEAGVVKIGVIAAITGQYAAVGEGYVNGFNLALEEWNATNELKFQATIEDDGAEGVKGLSAYKKLSGDEEIKAYAILTTFTVDVIYDMVHEEQKPIALGFEQTQAAEEDNIFQLVPAGKPTQKALGKEVKERGYKKPAAVVSNNTATYHNFYTGFVDGYGSDVKKFEIGSDITGIRSQALAIVASEPDVVAFFMAPRDGALLAKEILKISSPESRPYFVFDQSIQSGFPEYEKILGTDMAQLNGSIVSVPKSTQSSDFKEKYAAKYGTQPPFGSDVGYNSFLLLAQTYDDSPEKWIKNMENAEFAGADGDISFDAIGLRVPDVYFPKIENGKVGS